MKYKFRNKISLIDKIKMYWYGLKLKPRRMQGYSGKCTWVVASSHPLYSITWTWAIYWTKPSCWKFKSYSYIEEKEEFSLRPLFCFGFSVHTQDMMLKHGLKERW